MPSFHDFRFLSTDGKHNVFARECTPDGEVRAVLQIAHGVARSEEHTSELQSQR